MAREAQNTPKSGIFMIFKIPHFLILFAPENHFFTEVSISTKKNLKAEMANFPTKMSERLCHSHVKVVGGGVDPAP